MFIKNFHLLRFVKTKLWMDEDRVLRKDKALPRRSSLSEYRKDVRYTGKCNFMYPTSKTSPSLRALKKNDKSLTALCADTCY
jgi:hypothetical protein